MKDNIIRSEKDGKKYITGCDNTIGFVLNLDITETPKLLREGLAREFISIIQQKRKDDHLEITTRIEIIWNSSDDEFVLSLYEHTNMILSQSLSVRFTKQDDTTNLIKSNVNNKIVYWNYKVNN